MEVAGGRELVRPTKAEVIRDHLRCIDPSFVRYEAQFGHTLKYKNLSTPDRLAEDHDSLKPADLVAVYNTDEFPTDGFIRPPGYRDPKTLDFTTDFTINAPSSREGRYTILVPFDKIKSQVLQFHPYATQVLEEIAFPQGTVVIKDRNDTEPIENPGWLEVVEADYAFGGERITGQQRAVYEQMIVMGYFPQIAGKPGWSGWDDEKGLRALRKFCKENNLKLGLGEHYFEWTDILKGYAYNLQQTKEQHDPELFRRTVEEMYDQLFVHKKEWFEGQSLPDKYRNAAVAVARSYAADFPDIEIPEGLKVVEPTAEKAGAKIIDLSTDTEHFLHSTNLEMLPGVLRDGILSYKFAEKKLGIRLPEQTIRLTQEMYGMDLISVHDLEALQSRSSNYTSTLDMLQDKKELVGFLGSLNLLISPRVIGRRKRGPFVFEVPAESLIKRRIPPRFFDGLIVSQEYFSQLLNLPLKKIGEDKYYPYNYYGGNKYQEDILRRSRDTDETRRINPGGHADEQLTERYIEKPFEVAEAERLRKRLQEVNAQLIEQYKRNKFASVFGLPIFKDRRTGKIHVVSQDEYGIQEHEKHLEGLQKRVQSEDGEELREKVTLLEQILETKKEKYAIEHRMWQEYVEGLTGKTIEDSSVGDLLIGLCKVYGLPLYDTEGKVLWPKEEK